LLNVTASADNQLMDINAKHATLDKDKTQPTSRDALMPQLVLEPTKLLVSETSRPAMHAELAQPHTSQDQTDQSASDQDQLAHVLRDTLLMDTAAFHAQMDKFLTTTETAATQLQDVPDQDKFLELSPTATDATLAHQTLSQTTTEEPVLDQSQLAHVLRDTHKMYMKAKNVQIDKLLIQTTTRDVSQDNATLETRSSLPETTATDVTNAHLDTSQTHKELNALESSQLAVALKSMTKVDTSVSHAHHGKLPPTTTKDVSQDNAQDSTRFLVLLINAMLVKNAKRDLPQIT